MMNDNELLIQVKKCFPSIIPESLVKYCVYNPVMNSVFVYTPPTQEVFVIDCCTNSVKHTIKNIDQKYLKTIL